MKIRTEQHPWNVYEGVTFTAIDSDCYDGPGSPHGSGRTELEAILDLVEQVFDGLDSDNDRLRHENRCLRRELEAK